MTNKPGYFAKTAALYSFGALFAQGINFIAGPVFSKFLTPAEYGATSNFLFWSLLIGTIVGLQVGSTINNALISFKKNEIGSYIFSAVIIYPIVALLIGGVIYALREVVPKMTGMESYLIPIAIFTGLCIATVNVTLALKVALIQRRDYLVLLLIVSLTTFIMSLIFTLIIDDKVLGRCVGYLIGYLAAAILSVRYLSSITSGRKGQLYNKLYILYAIPLAAPLLLHEIFFLVMSQSNRVLLTHYSGLGAAGIFSLAYSLGSIGFILSGAINNTWTPWYYSQRSNKLYQEIENRYAILLNCFAIIIIILQLTLPASIIFFVGADYSNIAPLLPCVIAFGFFVTAFNLLANHAIYYKKTTLVTLASFISCVVSLAANTILLPVYGMYGASIALLVSGVVLVASMRFFVYRNKEATHMPVGSLMLASTAVLLSTALTTLTVGAWWTVITGAFLVMALSLYAYKKFKKQDYKVI